MNSFIISYNFEDQEYRGYFVTEEKNEKPRPCILIGPTWMGQNDQIKKIADQFAAVGYHVFVVDMFGEGKVAKDRDEAHALISYLLEDPIRIRERIRKAIETISSFNVTGCIFVGYCFGGTCAIEAIKANLDLKGSVSVHGVLGNYFRLSIRERPFVETTVPLLVLHGREDPFNSAQDLEDFQNIMTQKKVDWQLVIFGHAQHGFTNPKLHFSEVGLEYNKKAADRSFIYINNFIQEVL